MGQLQICEEPFGTLYQLTDQVVLRSALALGYKAKQVILKNYCTLLIGSLTFFVFFSATLYSPETSYETTPSFSAPHPPGAYRGSYGSLPGPKERQTD